jgi:hypothetical protein
MLKRIALAAALAVTAIAAATGSASARYWGDGHWHADHRDWNRHWYGYHYQAPPVVYGTPYNYGYTAPPVVYGGEPGINLNVHIP